MIHKELRLGTTVIDGNVLEVKNGDGISYDVTGQADFVQIEGDFAIIIDTKTGRGEYEHAVDNAQLRGLAALLWMWKPHLKRIRVAIVQPWVGQPTIADFDAMSLRQAFDWLNSVLDEVDAAEKNPIPVAGDWCKYCPARNRPCPALVAKGTAPLAQTLLARPLPDGKEKEALFARAMELTREELGGLLDKLNLYDQAASAIRGAARTVLDAGGEIPGWTLHASKPRESITDVAAVWGNLQRIGVSPEAFTAACSMTKKALEPLVRQATNAKGQSLKIAIAEALAGAVTMGKPTVKLVRVGEQLEDGE